MLFIVAVIVAAVIAAVALASAAVPTLVARGNQLSSALSGQDCAHALAGQPN